MTDITDVRLTVETMRRPGLHIMRTDDNRHWVDKEDHGPIATVGGSVNKGAFADLAPMDYADLFAAAPQLLKALEGMVDDYCATYGSAGHAATSTVKAAKQAIAAARKHQGDAAAVSADRTGI